MKLSIVSITVSLVLTVLLIADNNIDINTTLETLESKYPDRTTEDTQAMIEAIENNIKTIQEKSIVNETVNNALNGLQSELLSLKSKDAAKEDKIKELQQKIENMIVTNNTTSQGSQTQLDSPVVKETEQDVYSRWIAHKKQYQLQGELALLEMLNYTIENFEEIQTNGTAKLKFGSLIVSECRFFKGLHFEMIEATFKGKYTLKDLTDLRNVIRGYNI